MKKLDYEKNGKIELLRFIFAVFIVIYHYGGYVGGQKVSIGKNGYWGVEFFFLVSGFFFAKSAEINKKKITYAHVWKFMASKYLYYIKYYLAALFLIICKEVINRYSLKSILYNLIHTIPEVMLLGQLGFNNSEYYPNGYYVSTSWYLSTLFIIFFVFTPLIYYNYTLFVKNISPIVIGGTLAFLLLNFGKISVAFEPIGIGLAGLIRGACEICIGCVIYEVSKKYTKSCKTMELLEPILWMCVFLFMILDISNSVEFSMLIVTSFAVLLTAINNKTMKFFNNFVVYYLGKLSFPLLILHDPIIGIYFSFVKGSAYELHNRIIVFLVIILISMLFMFVIERLPNKLQN